MDGIVTQSVFFITGLVVAALLAGALASGVTEIAGGIQQHGDALANELRSAIRIASDPVKVPTNPLKLLVKNIGAKTLLTEEFLVLVDGAARPDADVAIDVLESTDDRTLGPGAVVQFSLSNLSLAAGDHDAQVIADTGASDRFRFRVS